jgi:hypothetical protein
MPPQQVADRNGGGLLGFDELLPLNSNLGTISTMPPEGYKPSYAGPYGAAAGSLV